ncbi:hypothetical protein GQ53DRAFT_740746 [Thozetella sp. PMI_491]|nr:hypothetical protein GQ53DRAFT_740746 [Thozetella sp. PMI_491]
MDAQAGVVSQQRSQLTHPRFGHNSINGDSIMCWPVLQELLQGVPAARRWAAPLDESADSAARHEPSPSIVMEMRPAAFEGPDGEEMQGDFAAVAETRPPEPEHVSEGIEMYFAHVHSKSPIFEPQWFYGLCSQISQQGWRPQYYAGPRSSRGICPTRICIYLIVVALGHVSAENDLPGRPIRPSQYFDYAFSWMGPSMHHQDGRLCPREKASGDGADLHEWIEKIQCLLLMGTHSMWCMRPWDARKAFGEAAILAKPFMNCERWSAALPEHTADLRFRVCCAAAKAESEMQEEMIGFGAGGSSILGFTDLEKLPKPPENAPSGGDGVMTQTWFYYLAEVASWKLLNRVSKELYQNLPPSPSLADFAALYPIAEELEAQIQDWASSLPVHVFNASLSTPNSALSEELSHHLKNRHFHARITTFRPFLQALILHGVQSAGSNLYPTVLDGALKCVSACVEFIESQPAPHRHFGSWRCGRGIWAAGLSVLAAVGTPELRAAMQGMPLQAGAHGVGVPAAGRRELARAEEATKAAAAWLFAWEQESPSLGLGAQILWAGLQEALRRGLFR